MGHEEHPAVTRDGEILRNSTIRAIALIAVSVGSMTALGIAMNSKSIGAAASVGVWNATIENVARASSDGKPGVSICGSSCRDAQSGASVASDERIVTDPRTRVRLALNDGSRIDLDRDTELTLVKNQRAVQLVRGVVMLDSAKDNGDARLVLPAGEARLNNARLIASVSRDSSTVDVDRGSVKLSSPKGSIHLAAGQEGRLERDLAPALASSESIEDFEVLGNEKPMERVDEPPRGIGELRAKKPGEKDERSQTLHIAAQHVKVRIVDAMARTEIEQVFANDSADTLEGIYRFPLPADAEIERLALDVDGRLEEGAFVERDRASKIWRGVIQNATPQIAKEPDIIWVPGPWRDPALLEWKRGGRSELRIFPIPARGSRRVVIAYTQVLSARAGKRTYTYPLAYDSQAKVAIDRFDVDLQVIGHDSARPVVPRGYALEDSSSSDAAYRAQLRADRFVPAGNLDVEYGMKDRNQEVTAWAFQDSPNEDGYVAFALRPKLPAWTEHREKLYVLAIDASRSMYGERFKRASQVAAAFANAADRRDRVRLLTCTTTCKRRLEDSLSPGERTADDISKALSSVVPEGATDLMAVARAGRDLGDSSRDVHVVYIGDGSVGAGPLTPSSIGTETRRIRFDRTTLAAVSVGADADVGALQAFARAGGGVLITDRAGERAGALANRVIGTLSGPILRAATVRLPRGLNAIAPRALESIPVGSETIVVARIEKGSERIDGDIELEGDIGTEHYTQRYPIRFDAREQTKNRFVPRLYASVRLNDLEKNDGDQAKSDIVKLSKQFSVASRYTSLLVLESEAMFRAFGVDRKRTAPEWSGEQESDSVVAVGQNQYNDVADESAFARKAAGGAGAASADGYADRAEPTRRAPVARSKSEEREAPMAGPFAPAPPAATMAAPVQIAEEPMRRRMVPMRRVWVRHGRGLTDDVRSSSPSMSAIRTAEEALDRNPDNRTKLSELLRLSMADGQFERARRLAERWLTRDPMDVDALAALADVTAQSGDRDRAVEFLESMADIHPDDKSIQLRLANLHEALGENEIGCAHRIAIAESPKADATDKSSAASCRQEGRAFASPPAPVSLRGDVRIDASWEEDADLDIALVGSDGQRYSALGSSRARVSGRDLVSSARESIAIANLPRGKYVVEITRTKGHSTRGTLELNIVGQRRQFSFDVRDRARVAAFQITIDPELVPL